MENGHYDEYTPLWAQYLKPTEGIRMNSAEIPAWLFELIRQDRELLLTEIREQRNEISRINQTLAKVGLDNLDLRKDLDSVVRTKATIAGIVASIFTSVVVAVIAASIRVWW